MLLNWALCGWEAMAGLLASNNELSNQKHLGFFCGSYWLRVAKTDHRKMGGFLGWMGVPQELDGLLHGKSIQKWVRIGGSPISGNLHIGSVPTKSTTNGIHGI